MSNHAQLSRPAFCWQPNGKLLLFALGFFPVLISLGFWQLHRAHEKQQILDQFIANRQAPPATLTDLNSGQNMQYRPASITGYLDAQHQIILDNRVKRGRPGYEILQSLHIAGEQKKLLVNRGWVPASLDRRVLPQVTEVVGEVQLRGFLYHSLPGGYRLDDGVTQQSKWPKRVGWITVARAEQLFGQDFFPYQLRLEADSVAALETGWVTVAVQPQKHTAYAVQWFAMAAVLIMMTVMANSNLLIWLKQRPIDPSDHTGQT